MHRSFGRAVLAFTLGTLSSTAAAGQNGPGVSDTEIKIGSTHPLSGPVAAYSTVGRSMAGYIAKVNAAGGVNGRKINFILLDDGYLPPRAVELQRKLVEQDEVLAIASPQGSASALANQKYLNGKGVPQLFVSSGATRWNDPKHFHWTIGSLPSYSLEGSIYAKHLLATHPGAKVAILYQHDEYGKDLLKGFLDGLGPRAKEMVVAQASYEITDPTVDSHLVSMKASGADVFFSITTPKFAAMALRKIAAMDWKVTQYLASVSTSMKAVVLPAGPEAVRGVISAAYVRDPSDPSWHKTPEYAEFLDVTKKYGSPGDETDILSASGVMFAQLLVQTLKQCGDDLSRENVMRQAANLDFAPSMLVPGIRVKTSPDDYAPLEQMQPIRFDGTRWVPFGEVLGR